MGAADGCDTPSYSSCQPCYTSLLHRGELSQSQTPILLLCLSQTIKEIVIPQIKPYSHCMQLCCSARNAREANQIHRCIRTTTAPQSQPPLPFYIAVLAPHHFRLLEPFRVAKTKASSSTQQQLSPGSKLSRKLVAPCQCFHFPTALITTSGRCFAGQHFPCPVLLFM